MIPISGSAHAPTSATPAHLRVLSWVVDLGLLIAVSLLVSMGSDLLGLIVGVVGGPAYYVLSEARGGTIGHRLTGSRVVDTETTGAAPLTSLGIRLAVVGGMLLPLGIPFVANAVMTLMRPGWVPLHDVCSRSEVRR